MSTRSPFARKLSLKIALASTILLLIVLLSVTAIQAGITLKNCAANLDNQLELCAEKIDAEFEAIQEFTGNTGILMDRVSLDEESYRQTLTQLIDANPSIFGIYVYLNPTLAAQSGIVVPGVFKPDEGEPAKFLIERKPFVPEEYVIYDMVCEQIKENPWFGPYLEHTKEKDIYELSYMRHSPGYDGHGSIVTEVVVTMDWLVRSLQTLRPYPHAEVYLINTEGKIVCNSEREMPTYGEEYQKDSLANAQVVDEHYYEVERQHMSDTTNVYNEINLKGLIQGKARFGRQYTLSNGWTLCVNCPFKEVFADVRKSVLFMGLGMLACIVLLFIFCSRIIYKKSRPLNQFASTSKRIAQGDFDTELPIIKDKDEVSQLRDSFVDMQRSLKQYIHDLKVTTAENERMESELTLATDIQLQALKKTFPQNSHFEIYAAMHAAKEVGGDLYDYVLKGDKLYLCIGDVSGKGVPAALLMMTVTMQFRQLCNSTDMTVSELVSVINDTVADGNDSGFFLTLAIACIDLNTMKMQFCSGGHNDIVIIPANGNAYYHKAKRNVLCGIFAGFAFKEETVQLESGCRLLFYTDGVDEAMDKQDQKYGYARLLEWAGSSMQYTDEQSVVDSLITSVATFTDGAEQSDDITILSVRMI